MTRAQVLSDVETSIREIAQSEGWTEQALQSALADIPRRHERLQKKRMRKITDRLMRKYRREPWRLKLN